MFNDKKVWKTRCLVGQYNHNNDNISSEHTTTTRNDEAERATWVDRRNTGVFDGGGRLGVLSGPKTRKMNDH